MSRLRLALGLAAAAAVPLGIGAACFSERPDSTEPIVPGAAQCRVPVTVIDSMHVVVAINNFAFVPDSILIPVGTTVTWVNCEPAIIEPHTTTSDSPGWASPQFPGGERFSRRFDSPGVFPYHCEPHPFMVAKIVVQ